MAAAGTSRCLVHTIVPNAPVWNSLSITFALGGWGRTLTDFLIAFIL